MGVSGHVAQKAQFRRGSTSLERVEQTVTSRLADRIA
jgi:hypothetical protein